MNELTYTMQGDYNLPDLTMPQHQGNYTTTWFLGLQTNQHVNTPLDHLVLLGPSKYLSIFFFFSVILLQQRLS